jgi:lipoprotein NlpI
MRMANSFEVIILFAFSAFNVAFVLKPSYQYKWLNGAAAVFFFGMGIAAIHMSH